MNYANQQALVETEWLADHLNAPDIRVVDASYYLPGEEGDARADYEACHIQGARFFDIDDIADETSDLPHMLPSPEKFSSRVRRMGLGDGTRIVCYDSRGMLFAARAWWMFRVFGHEDVAILNGGLPKWLSEDRPTEDRPPTPRERHFTARFNNFLVRDIDQMLANVESGAAAVLDARGAGRFAGTEPELRAGLRAGHIPSSRNLPYSELFDPTNGTIRCAEDLAACFESAEIARDGAVITTCGSGISATALAFGLYLLGNREVAVYDGSWTEWGGREDTPIEK